MKTPVLGIGIDIENINRFKKLELDKKSRFLNKIFTPRELDYCFSKKNIASSLATKYTAKEAVIKAYNTLGETSLDYKQVEVTNNKTGAPEVKITKDKIKKYRIMISLSNGTEQAVGVALIIN